MRVLVCGGRKFDNQELINSVLDRVSEKTKISLVIHGDASGADTLAKAWAKSHRIDTSAYPAQWSDCSHSDSVRMRRPDGSHYDARAGLRRNQRMIDVGTPDLVVAFAGGGGTRDMMRRARKAGIPVLDLALHGDIDYEIIPIPKPIHDKTRSSPFALRSSVR